MSDFTSYQHRFERDPRMAGYNPAFVKKARANNKKRESERLKKEELEKIEKARIEQEQFEAAQRELVRSVHPHHAHVMRFYEVERNAKLRSTGIDPKRCIPLDKMREEFMALENSPMMSEVLRKTRYVPLVAWRQALAHMYRYHSMRSLPEIGRYIGFDHTTVLHSVRKVDEAIAQGNVDKYELPCGANLYVRRF